MEEQQRRDLAFQLHDGVSQELAAASIKLQQAISKTENGNALELLEINGLIQEAIGHVQTLTTDLSPPVLYELGISPALSSLAASLSKQFGIVISFDSPAKVAAPGSSLSIHLYRIARELLVNAIKHSGADRIRVTLESNSEFVRLTVGDNGKGIDPKLIEMKPDSSKTGFGLFSIRQRLGPLGGSMDIRNDDGAEVRIRVPRFEGLTRESRET